MLGEYIEITGRKSERLKKNHVGAKRQNGIWGVMELHIELGTGSVDQKKTY